MGRDGEGEGERWGEVGRDGERWGEMAPPSAGHSRRAGSGAVASLARGHHRTGLFSLLGPAGPDGGALISLSEQIWRAGGHDRRAPRQLLRPHTPRCDACRPPLPTPYSVLSRVRHEGRPRHLQGVRLQARVVLRAGRRAPRRRHARDTSTTRPRHVPNRSPSCSSLGRTTASGGWRSSQSRRSRPSRRARACWRQQPAVRRGAARRCRWI